MPKHKTNQGVKRAPQRELYNPEEIKWGVKKTLEDENISLVLGFKKKLGK